VPVFLVLALNSGDGAATPPPSTIYAVIGATDYLDGMTARGYGASNSRLGALLDPLVDRLLVISGVIVTYHFEAAAALGADRAGGPRAGDAGAHADRHEARDGPESEHGGPLGGVWPTMFSMFLAMVSTTWVAPALLYLGLAMTLWATALYFRDGWNAMHQNTQA